MTPWRADVVRIAQEWLRTPFLPRACAKGRGCDCGSFLAGVYAEAGVLPALALGRYDYAGPALRGDDVYLRTALAHADAIPEAAIQPGDFVLYRMGRAFAHGALVVRWPHFVLHAVRGAGVIGADGVGGMLRGRERQAFALKGTPC